MVKGDIPSPDVFDFTDNFFDAASPNAHVIRLTVNWDTGTRALTSAAVFRSADCQWTHVVIGVGPDGSPNTAPASNQFDLTGFSGSRSFTAAQVAARGFHTIDDVLSTQLTAY